MGQDYAGVVIIGAGHGGEAVASFLRQFGYEGRIVLLSDEKELPYHRPPLSKGWLKGETDAGGAALRDREYFEKRKIELRLSVRVDALDPSRKELRLSDGSHLNYDKLVIATGSRALIPPIPGIDTTGVLALRTARDASLLRTSLGNCQNVAIVGGGYIGLEVAATAIAMGKSTTVIEREPRLLARSASSQLADFFARYHRERGVSIMLGETVTAIESDGSRLCALRTDSGKRVDCDVALIGVGAVPNSELASEAGLACENGIIVDLDARTSDKDVFAIGDVTQRPVSPYGFRARLESVANAVEQARQAACAIVLKDTPKAEVTWNWSDQYDVKFQVAGLPVEAVKAVVRGNIDEAKFSIFHLNSENRVQQVEAVNAPGDFMLGKKLIASRSDVDPARLEDLSVPLKDLLG